MSKRWSDSDRLDWVLRWRASGLSCAQFAARHGLSKATLYTWSHRLGRTASVPKALKAASVPSTGLSRASSTRASFTQVRVVGSTVSAPSVVHGGVIEVVLGDGRLVRVHGAVNETSLRSVLRVVSEC